jgi:hypothetical protein
LIAAAVATSPACAGVARPAKPSAPVPGATLWAEPSDLATRDLYYGPWGRSEAPDPDAVYELVERKHTGVNLGMTVTDPKGREWSVKQPYAGSVDSEAPVEVVLSRLLSAVGYHQPPVYFLPAFRLKDELGTRTEVGGRFRLKYEALKEVGDWRWDENPFVGKRSYQGLLVMLMMFNSTDLKASNNSVYERTRGNVVERWYTVRDLGAALGDTNPLAPRKNHPETFGRSPFILGVDGRWVDFAYDGWYRNLVRDRITPADVVWASNLLGRLSERQWNDAFRAAGYEPHVADEFIRMLRTKLQQGRSVAKSAAADDDQDRRRIPTAPLRGHAGEVPRTS